MSESIRVFCLGFPRSELRMMQLALEAAASTLARKFRITKANESADVAVINWSTLNIERTQAFLAEKFPDVPLISVSETGVLGAPGLCSSEDLLLQTLPALVYEALEGLEPAARARPPEYVSWLSVRRTWIPEVPAMLRNTPDPVRGLELHKPEPVRRKPPPIPRHELPATSIAGRAKTPNPPAVVSLPFEPLGRMKVLVATPDETAVAEDLVMLRSLGAEVVVTSETVAIQKAYSTAAVDLVLIDARWPQEQGYRLCRTLAHLSVRVKVPIIMVAPDLRPIERARAAFAGSQGLMRWPITEQQVIERVPIVMAGPRVKPVKV